jgi:predicted dienelactone hydrolase
MRPLEIVIPVLLAIYLGWPLFSGKRKPVFVNLLPAAALVLIAVHLVVEKYRWQMIPLYALALVCFLTSLPALIRRGGGAFRRRSWASVGLALSLLLTALFAAVPVLLPVPTTPAPTGPHKVGTLTLTLTDSSRKELYSGNPNDPRKFMIQVWYPARPANNAQTAPWMPNADIVAPAIAHFLHLPDFFLNHLELSRTSSYENAPLDPSGGPYPVLVFSHGWEGFRAQNTFQVQELASQGYVVVGMEHTYGSVVTVFPDGQVAYNNPQALPSNLTGDAYDQAARKLVAQWSGDIGYALDTLAKLNVSDPQDILQGAMDLNKVGVFGHSTGGGATVQFCATDSRCKAGMPMDAFMSPVSAEVLDHGMSQPFLFLWSQTFSSTKNTALFNRMLPHVAQPVGVYTIQGTAHYDFSDLPSLTPLAPMLGLKGPLEAGRVIQIIDSYSLAFFNQTLKGAPSPLLANPVSAYPEVKAGH